MANEKEQTVELQIKFRIPQKLPSVIAHEMVVQPGADGVLLSFFEVQPPIIPPGITAEQINLMQQAGVTAECVSKVFVPHSKFEDFVNALSGVSASIKKIKAASIKEVKNRAKSS